MRTRAVAGLLLGAALLAGCGGTATDVAPPPAPAAAPAAAVTTAAQAAPAGVVRLAGDVCEPRDLQVAELAALPQQTVAVQYQSGQGPQSHTETGVLLADLLPPDALATTDRHNDLLAFGVLAVGADGYAALVAYGEVSPQFGNRGILLATAEDGQPLERPQLVVPGDVRGGRYVHDVVELRVVRVG
ncbi:hypothetical protein BJF78_08260 [Pseudonocardia sp. CNS-139]|nr:hypothetical protein BJF78_08260 [Pseudonocardia sp. CNS-139]